MDVHEDSVNFGVASQQAIYCAIQFAMIETGKALGPGRDHFWQTRSPDGADGCAPVEESDKQKSFSLLMMASAFFFVSASGDVAPPARARDTCPTKSSVEVVRGTVAGLSGMMASAKQRVCVGVHNIATSPYHTTQTTTVGWNVQTTRDGPDGGKGRQRAPKQLG